MWTLNLINNNNNIEYSILPENLYNFDETGFAMNIIATSRIITSCKVYGNPRLLQPGNHEWVITIETIDATGKIFSPYIIFKAKEPELQGAWFKDLSTGWRLDKSDNEWTTDEIGIK